MAFDPNDSALRDVTVRKGEFREVARDVVWKDRQSRKGGATVDTGGAITRAMEQAYKLGLKHGEKQLPEGNAISLHPDAPSPWNSIPPKPRGIYRRILSFGWIVLLDEDDNPWLPPKDKWACYWDWGEKKQAEERIQFAHAFSVTTLAPIIKMGLMKEHVVEDQVFLIQTEKGKATWKRAIDDGHVRPTR